MLLLPLGNVVLGGNKNLWTKNFFFIKVSLPWEWFGTFDEILYYKVFLLSSFTTTNQTSCKYYNMDFVCIGLLGGYEGCGTVGAVYHESWLLFQLNAHGKLFPLVIL